MAIEYLTGNRRRVVVVGAGIAGLTFAHYLAKADPRADIVVAERSPEDLRRTGGGLGLDEDNVVKSRSAGLPIDGILTSHFGKRITAGRTASPVGPDDMSNTRARVLWEPYNRMLRDGLPQNVSVRFGWSFDHCDHDPSRGSVRLRFKCQGSNEPEVIEATHSVHSDGANSRSRAVLRNDPTLVNPTYQGVIAVRLVLPSDADCGEWLPGGFNGWNDKQGVAFDAYPVKGGWNCILYTRVPEWAKKEVLGKHAESGIVLPGQASEEFVNWVKYSVAAELPYIHRRVVQEAAPEAFFARSIDWSVPSTAADIAFNERSFLISDAAHVFYPYLGGSLNVGLQEAASLAIAIATGTESNWASSVMPAITEFDVRSTAEMERRGLHDDKIPWGPVAPFPCLGMTPPVGATL